MVGLREEINDSFDALRLSEHPEVPEEHPQSLVYAQVVEVERLQVLFQDVLELVKVSEIIVIGLRGYGFLWIFFYFIFMIGFLN
jgi:hypothetical protein